MCPGNEGGVGSFVHGESLLYTGRVDVEQSLHRNQIAPSPAGEPDPTAAAALASPVRHLRVPCKSVGLFQSYPSPQTLLWVTCLTHLPETEPARGTEPQNPSGAAQPELRGNLTFRAAGAAPGRPARCVGSDPARARGLGEGAGCPGCPAGCPECPAGLSRRHRRHPGSLGPSLPSLDGSNVCGRTPARGGGVSSRCPGDPTAAPGCCSPGAASPPPCSPADGR